MVSLIFLLCFGKSYMLYIKILIIANKGYLAKSMHLLVWLGLIIE